MLTLEHIDPRKGALVSGLENEFNEIIADLSYNSRKGNRFLPYRVCNYSAPTTFGDIGEFLVEGEWVVCEFGGAIWWKETNRVGCNAMARAYAPASNIQRKEAQKVGLSNRGRTHTHSPENKDVPTDSVVGSTPKLRDNSPCYTRPRSAVVPEWRLYYPRPATVELVDNLIQLNDVIVTTLFPV